ncbi:hypothetical protein ACIRPX_29705 [Streptomyces sp. NPDC101225]|uniref:hypothetical protein n=1 Tax=Streptomyces sp. NPDC101225 TaxID=3366135 RepID=UPI0037F98010
MTATDLLERPLVDPAGHRHAGDGVEVTLRPFQILTLRSRPVTGTGERRARRHGRGDGPGPVAGCYQASCVAKYRLQKSTFARVATRIGP